MWVGGPAFHFQWAPLEGDHSGPHSWYQWHRVVWCLYREMFLSCLELKIPNDDRQNPTSHFPTSYIWGVGFVVLGLGVCEFQDFGEKSDSKICFKCSMFSNFGFTNAQRMNIVKKINYSQRIWRILLRK